MAVTAVIEVGAHACPQPLMSMWWSRWMRLVTMSWPCAVASALLRCWPRVCGRRRHWANRVQVVTCVVAVAAEVLYGGRTRGLAWCTGCVCLPLALTYGTGADRRAIRLEWWLPSAGNGMQRKRPRRTVCGDWQSPGTDWGAGRGSPRWPTECQHHPPPNKGCTDGPGDPLSRSFAI